MAEDREPGSGDQASRDEASSPSDESAPSVPVSEVALIAGAARGLFDLGGSRRCAFCGRREQSVAHLVRARETYVCDECIAFAHEAVVAAPAGQKLIRLRPRPRLPADREGAEDAIVRAYYTLFDAPLAERCDAIEGGSNLGPILEQAGGRVPGGGQLDIVVDYVRFIAEDEAEVQFVLLLPGSVFARIPSSGHAVFVDGAWKVARATYCGLVSRIGVQCPPPPAP